MPPTIKTEPQTTFKSGWISDMSDDSNPDDSDTSLSPKGSLTRALAGASAKPRNNNRQTGKGDLAKLRKLFQKLSLTTQPKLLQITLKNVQVISCQDCQRWSWFVPRSGSPPQVCLSCGSKETITSSKPSAISPETINNSGSELTTSSTYPSIGKNTQPSEATTAIQSAGTATAMLSADTATTIQSVETATVIQSVENATNEAQDSIIQKKEIFLNVYDSHSLVVRKLPLNASKCPSKRSLLRALREKLQQHNSSYKSQLQKCKVVIDYTSKEPLFNKKHMARQQKKIFYRKWYRANVQKPALAKVRNAKPISIKFYGNHPGLKSGPYGVQPAQKIGKRKRDTNVGQNTAAKRTNNNHAHVLSADFPSTRPKTSNKVKKKKSKSQQDKAIIPTVGLANHDALRPISAFRHKFPRKCATAKEATKKQRTNEKRSYGKGQRTEAPEFGKEDKSPRLGKRKFTEYLSNDSDGIDQVALLASALIWKRHAKQEKEG